MMKRGSFVLLSLLGLGLWSWLVYFNVWFALRHGIPLPYAILSPSCVGPLFVLLIALTQLWKYLTAERKENILDPKFTLTASQPHFVRVAGTLMCVSFLAAGALRFLSDAPALPDSPIMNALYIAIGILGALFTLFSPRMRLSLSPEGFEYSQMRPARVPWHDITEVKLRSFLTTSWIILTLKDTAEYRPANPLARWRKAAKVSVYPRVFGIDAEVLKQGIDLRRNVFTF